MDLTPRIESLARRHSILDQQISDEDHRPMPDQRVLMRLKLQKLRIKEEIDRLRNAG
ncbi:YdcH family protein [Acetobacter sp. AN02]|uniref:YdcH family protein n=1 Tax=Acetobacter sp. AN02 TaxID=2894186 RepID=UPI0024345410|nr:YdcH family protein [Acetobacter sp. AN02]MDG6093962.1 YdcH family protein [Acetobacter sp. AN02]